MDPWSELTCLAQANFWTGPWPYWDMKTRAPEVWSDLRESSLVILKVCGSITAAHSVRLAQFRIALSNRATSSELACLLLLLPS